MSLPTNFLYSTEHIWVQNIDKGIWQVGITDYAQAMLGDIVFLDLPAIGDFLKVNESCGTVESVKTSAAIYAPLDGHVLSHNPVALESPEKINDEPYQTWLFVIKTHATTTHLKSALAYQALLDSLS